jgi:protein-disulfide isomerase
MAEPAAETAEFAAAKRKFWEMHNAIFENQQELSLPLLAELAEAFNLSPEDAMNSLEGHEFAAKVRSDFSGGVRSGVNGTPTFFINGQRYEGMPEFQTLVEAIDEELAASEPRRKRA